MIWEKTWKFFGGTHRLTVRTEQQSYGPGETRERDLETMLRYAVTGRCVICGFPLAKSREEGGCVPGDCSYRDDGPAQKRAATFARRQDILQDLLHRG